MSGQRISCDCPRQSPCGADIKEMSNIKGWITRFTCYDGNDNIVDDREYEVGEMSYSDDVLIYTDTKSKGRGGYGNILKCYEDKFRYNLNNDIYCNIEDSNKENKE